jgi:CheY-like chemotaxis protein
MFYRSGEVRLKSAILLVDDQLDLISVMKEALSGAYPHCQIIDLDSAEETLHWVEKHSLDAVALVVADHQLGSGATGLDLLGRLKALRGSLPALLYTGQATPGEEDAAEALGVRVLWKPLRLQQWLGEVRTLLDP